MANYGTDSAINLSQFATKETNRILGKINQGLVQRSVWTNVLKGSTFPTGMGDTLRTVVQLPSFSPINYQNPALTDFTAICGERGHQTKHSTVEYTTKLQTLRGRGPDVCVNQGFGAFKGYMEAATTMLANDIRLIRDSIDRAQVYTIAGTKYVCDASVGFTARINGGTELDAGVVLAANTLPDASISFNGLRTLVAYVKENLFADPYTLKVDGVSGGYDHFALFIGSQEVIDNFRRETAVQTEINALATGGFKLAEKAITGLNFQTAGAWKGIAMKADQFPLRFNAIAAGVPTFLNPFVEVVDDAGALRSHRKTNPTWLTATHEVAFLMFDNAIERLVPERYTGDGTAKFDVRLGNGQIEWHYAKDNMTNLWGDFGFHKYELTQAYRPIRPHHCVAILYKRCAVEDIVACV